MLFRAITIGQTSRINALSWPSGGLCFLYKTPFAGLKTNLVKRDRHKSENQYVKFDPVIASVFVHERSCTTLKSFWARHWKITRSIAAGHVTYRIFFSPLIVVYSSSVCWYSEWASVFLSHTLFCFPEYPPAHQLCVNPQLKIVPDKRQSTLDWGTFEKRYNPWLFLDIIIDWSATHRKGVWLTYRVAKLRPFRWIPWDLISEKLCFSI